MSEENVGTLQRANQAWNADNLDAFLAEADPEVEWYSALEQAWRAEQAPNALKVATLIGSMGLISTSAICALE